jgi:chromosome segregation ATPase
MESLRAEFALELQQYQELIPQRVQIETAYLKDSIKRISNQLDSARKEISQLEEALASSKDQIKMSAETAFQKVCIFRILNSRSWRREKSISNWKASYQN